MHSNHVGLRVTAYIYIAQPPLLQPHLLCPLVLHAVCTCLGICPPLLQQQFFHSSIEARPAAAPAAAAAAGDSGILGRSGIFEAGI